MDPEARGWQALVRRDVCSFCGERAVDADHIDPLSGGGDNRYGNFTGACRRCNRAKRDKPLLLFMLERAR